MRLRSLFLLFSSSYRSQRSCASYGIHRKCVLDLSVSFCVLDWTSWISLFLIRRVVRLRRKCVWDLSFLSHRNVVIHRIRRVVLIHRPSYVVRFRRKCVWDLCFLFYAKLLSIVSSIVCRSPVVLFILFYFFSGCGGYMKTHFCDDAVSDIPWAFPFPHALFVCLFVSIDCSSFPVSLRPSCPKKWFW